MAARGKTPWIASIKLWWWAWASAACTMPLGIFGMTPEAVKPHIQAGYSLIAVGVDTVLLANSASQIVQQLALGQ